MAAMTPGTELKTMKTAPCYVPRIDPLPIGESGCATDDPPCDFVIHIAQRLGIDRDAAQATLHEWLLQYEPQTASTVAARLATGS